MEDEVTAQALRFVRSAVFCSHIGIGVWEWCFRVWDVAVTLGFAFQAVASKLCFRDKS